MRPARALLVFTASDAAPRSVLVPEGFQVSASAADGSGATVIFETERKLHAAPGQIELSFVQEGNRFYEVDLSGSDAGNTEPAFGSNPKPGSGLLLALNSGIEPQPNITIGIQLSAKSGAPPPVATGSVEPIAGIPQPFLRWEFFDGGSFEAAEVIRDETNNLRQSGVVELRSPRRWRPGTPAGIGADKPLRWLRLKIVFGEFDNAPTLAFVRLNLVAAVAARTVRNEVLEYIPDSDGRRLRLSQKPVLAGSLQLTVNEGVIGSTAQLASGDTATGSPVTWKEVDDLNASGPDDRVYELDSATGELQFGDGIHGANLPRGFRNVVAERYQLATGSAGAVDAEQITGLVSSAPFLVGVSNPLPASGGRDEDSLQQTLLSGPEKIRARDRAVTTADYELMALLAKGADIRRAHAVAGMHAGLNGAGVPGAVSVFLLGPPRSDGPPYPDPGSLDAVSRYLSERIAPAGVEVVAAAPQFHRVGVRALLGIAAAADDGNVIRQTLLELDAFFDPFHGGDQGRGWPFGGVVYHDALVRRLLERVDNLLAVSTLNLVVDGEALPTCTDFAPEPNTLLWPDTHELQVLEEAAS
jgi:predicted phage baseplate assembly protein